MADEKTKKSMDFNLSDLCAERLGTLLRKTLENCEATHWKRGWIPPTLSGCTPRNVEGKDYGFCNSFLLGMAVAVNEWKTPYFCTMNHVRELGLTINKTGVKENGKPKCEEQFPVFMTFTSYVYRHDGVIENLSYKQYMELDSEAQEKCYRKTRKTVVWVWNIDQTDYPTKYPDKYAKLLEQAKDMRIVQNENHEEDCIDDVLEYIITDNHWICPIVSEGKVGAHSEAFFNGHLVHIPRVRDFVSHSEYYGTALHEMAHSTKLVEQCKRDIRPARYHGDPHYALEEMVAELSAAIVMHDLGFEKTIDENHLVYVKHWADATRRKDAVGKVINEVLKVSKYMLRYYDEKYDELVQGTAKAA